MPVHKPKASDDNGTRGYLGEAEAARYVGYSRDGFRRLVRQGIFPRGIFLTPNSKAIWNVRHLDAAIEKGLKKLRVPQSGHQFAACLTGNPRLQMRNFVLPVTFRWTGTAYVVSIKFPPGRVP